MKVKSYTTYRLVKSEDLNHHGTLFAGRGAEWFVEAGFISAANILNPKNLICVNIHGLHFSRPVKAGQNVCLESKIIHTGSSSLISYIKVFVNDDENLKVVDGFATFVYVDENTKPQNHNIKLELTEPKDIELNEIAKKLKENKW